MENVCSIYSSKVIQDTVHQFLSELAEFCGRYDTSILA